MCFHLFYKHRGTPCILGTENKMVIYLEKEHERDMNWFLIAAEASPRPSGGWKRTVPHCSEVPAGGVNAEMGTLRDGLVWIACEGGPPPLWH